MQMLVRVDDPLCIGKAKLVENWFTATVVHDEDHQHRSDRAEASRVPRHTRVEDTHRDSE